MTTSNLHIFYSCDEGDFDFYAGVGKTETDGFTDAVKRGMPTDSDSIEEDDDLSYHGRVALNGADPDAVIPFLLEGLTSGVTIARGDD